jgi:heptosyltransferase-2
MTVFAEFKPDTIRRILVRGPNWVGDAVMCTPAMQGIRQTFPSAEISLLALPTVANLLKGHSSFDRTIVYEHQDQHAGFLGTFRLAKILKAQVFDVAVLFPNAFDAALLTFLARIPRRYGYATDGRSWLLTDAVSLPPQANTLHQVRYYEELVRPLCPTYSSKPPVLIVSEDDESQAAKLLTANVVPEDCVLVGLNPGSMYGGAKRWLPERFAEAADQVVESLARKEKFSAVKVVIVGAPGEEGLGQQIAGLMRTHPVVLSGQTSLGVLKAVIKRFRLFLTNDTGPMHIANALGIPVIAVFGPTDHTTTSPFASGHVVVRTPVNCSPCLLRECPIDHRCMTGVTVEQVVQGTQQVLNLGTAVGRKKDV